MEDYDRIELGYVLDEEPSIDVYESLFEIFPEYPGEDYGREEYTIRARKMNEHHNEVDKVGESADVIQALSTYPNWSIEVPLRCDELTVTSSRDNHGLLSGLSDPYIEFSTWIYALQEPDDRADLHEIKEARRELVEVLTEAANILEPKWGFGRRGGLAIGEDETIEALAAMPKPPLYEYNVFREETVETIGRERVLSASAYHVEPLDSGGVFVAVREPPKQCASHIDTCTDVADHLGLNLATPERYH